MAWGCEGAHRTTRRQKLRPGADRRVLTCDRREAGCGRMNTSIDRVQLTRAPRATNGSEPTSANTWMRSSAGSNPIGRVTLRAARVLWALLRIQRQSVDKYLLQTLPPRPDLAMPENHRHPRRYLDHVGFSSRKSIVVSQSYIYKTTVPHKDL